MTTKAAVVHSKCESCDISAYAVARRLSALEVERSISSECGDYASYSACYQERKKKKKKKKSVMQPGCRLQAKAQPPISQVACTWALPTQENGDEVA